MYVIYFILVPLILITVFVLANLNPSLSKYYGNAGNLVSFLTAILTYIYVVLTGLMVRQMIKTSEEESRPFVIVDFESNDHLMHFIVRNIGKLSAKNLQIKLQPDLMALGKTSMNETIFSKPITMMPPGKEIKSFVGMSHEMLKVGQPKVFEVSLIYEWGKKNRTIEDYTLDISFNEKRLFVGRKNIHDIAKTLDEINRNFSRVVKWDGIYIKTSKDIKKEAEETAKWIDEVDNEL